MVFVDAGKFVIFIIEGKSHDAGILRRSHLLDELERNCNTEYGDPLCIYGDSAYPERMHLQTPYKGNNLNNDQKAFNTAMSKVRVSVEWVFGEIAGYFAFIDFKKNKKIGLQQVGTMYIRGGPLDILGGGVSDPKKKFMQEIELEKNIPACA